MSSMQASTIVSLTVSQISDWFLVEECPRKVTSAHDFHRPGQCQGTDHARHQHHNRVIDLDAWLQKGDRFAATGDRPDGEPLGDAERRERKSDKSVHHGQLRGADLSDKQSEAGEWSSAGLACRTQEGQVKDVTADHAGQAKDFWIGGLSRRLTHLN